MAIPSLSLRASVRLPSSRFQPLLPEPGVPISGTGLSSGIMRLAHGPPGRLGHTGRGSDPRHHLRPLHGFRSAYPSRIRRAVEPVHASTTSNLYRSTPSLMHVMLPESSPSTRGPGIATPASSLPSDIAPHLRPLSSAGITRRLRSYGPLRHPDGPACPSRDSGWCVHTTDRASRVASIPLLHACRRHYPGGTGQCARRSLPSRWQPSPFYRRVGFRITRFEACSAFTKVAARMLAEPPMAALLIGVLQTRSLPPSPAPTATGWSDSCRAGFAPAEGRRLRTAHGKVGLGRVSTNEHYHVNLHGWNSRKLNTNASRHTSRCSAATSPIRTSRCSTPSCMSPNMAANGAGYRRDLATGTPSTSG